MKIRPKATELFHAGGRADRKTDGHDEANIQLFRNFSNAPKNSLGGSNAQSGTKTGNIYFFKTHWKGKPHPQNRKPESGPRQLSRFHPSTACNKPLR